jgi:hypothetical protein
MICRPEVAAMNTRLPALALLGCLALAGVASGETVDAVNAAAVAAAAIRDEGQERAISSLTPYPPEEGAPLFFVAALDPAGFVVVAGDSELPAVVGFSFENDFPSSGAWHDRLVSLLRTDLGLRLEQVAKLPAERRERRRQTWERLLTNRPRDAVPQQWPPAGSTSTGGWVETRWTQNAPYSDQCPVDPVTHVRSLAGCPAVAMAQILDYHHSTNRTTFSDADDYYHSYSGRNYWIDNDFATIGFPSFPQLSASLANLEQHYASHSGTTSADAAALVFACGVAARQVYTSQGSGTFGVSQAWDAYVRFGVAGISLITVDSPALYERLAQNMKDGLPAHLAVVDTAVPPSSGHNLVVDGYRDDGYFHLNYGWGGSADGWYVIPDEIPYGLTVIEGVIVDIALPLLRDGFESGDLSAWSETSP